MKDDKLEGKRKLVGMALALGLAIVLFATTYLTTSRNGSSRDISQIHVDQDLVWEPNTVTRCTLTVYNIESVNRSSDVNEPEYRDVSIVCGKLTCAWTSPIIKEPPQTLKYVCVDLATIH